MEFGNIEINMGRIENNKEEITKNEILGSRKKKKHYHYKKNIILYTK